MTWHEWKAGELNRMLGGGNITPETVRHGEHEIRGQWDSRAAGFTKDQLRRTAPRKWKGLRERA
jgi:hypothetical protein